MRRCDSCSMSCSYWTAVPCPCSCTWKAAAASWPDLMCLLHVWCAAGTAGCCTGRVLWWRSPMNDKLQDFTVGLKICEEASSTAIDIKLQWSNVKDVSVIQKGQSASAFLCWQFLRLKIMAELCIYFVSKGPLTEKYHSTIFFSSNILVHCYNHHFWPHLLVLAVCSSINWFKEVSYSYI